MESFLRKIIMWLKDLDSDSRGREDTSEGDASGEGMPEPEESEDN